MTKSLDILIPVFFEEKVIIKTINKLIKNIKCNYKIHICFDTYNDPTIKTLKKKFLKHKKLNYIKNNSTGFNQALISGIKKTNGDAVIFYMADDIQNSKLIDRCFNKYLIGFDVVCPSRFTKGGNMIGNSFIKGLLTRISSSIIYNFSNFPVMDCTNSFRLFSRKVLKKMKFESRKGFTLSFEISAKSHRKGYKFTEIPCTWKERNKGRSKFKLYSFIKPYLRWMLYIFESSLFYVKKN